MPEPPSRCQTCQQGTAEGGLGEHEVPAARFRARQQSGELAAGRYQVATQVLTYASGRGRSSPDLVISSSEHPTDSWQVLDPWGSDHCPVLFDVPFPGFRQPEPKAQKRWAWHLADWAGFRAEVDAFSTKVLRWQDPHESANRFASAVKKAAKRHIGYCSNKARSKGWWSKPVAEAISARNNEARRQRSLASISTADATLLTDLRRRAKEAIDEAKRVQLEKLLSSSTSGNPKPMFDFLRRADGRGAKRAAVNLVSCAHVSSTYARSSELEPDLPTGRSSPRALGTLAGELYLLASRCCAPTTIKIVSGRTPPGVLTPHPPHPLTPPSAVTESLRRATLCACLLCRHATLLRYYLLKEI